MYTYTLAHAHAHACTHTHTHTRATSHHRETTEGKASSGNTAPSVSSTEGAGTPGQKAWPSHLRMQERKQQREDRGEKEPDSKAHLQGVSPLASSGSLQPGLGEPVTLSRGADREPCRLGLRKKPGSRFGSERVVKAACLAFFSPLSSQAPASAIPQGQQSSGGALPQRREGNFPSHQRCCSLKAGGKLICFSPVFCLPQYGGRVAGMCGRVG